MEVVLKNLAIKLYEINAVKFGEFVTKVGLKTPIYFDLRAIIGYPALMSEFAKALWELAEDSANVSQLCGVPYTALPLATLISTQTNIPMLIKRKEAKSYGTKKMIEGQFKPGDNCIIIEDVCTSGSSILETVQALKNEGLVVTMALTIIDREQGGRSNLEYNEVPMKSLYTVTKLLQYLLESEKISHKVVQDVADYLKATQTTISHIKGVFDERLKLRFSKRANISNNKLTSKLFRLMDAKKSTICLAADLTKSDDILQLAEITGPHIVVLKTHIDIVEDFNDNFVKRLRALAKKHDFLIMEDRKFADIGNTVCLQYSKGIYRIAEWADIVTVHAVAGPTIIQGLQTALDQISEPRGIFLVTEMSSKDALTTGDYVKSAISIAQSHDIVMGLVCQSNVFSNPELIQLTPGIKLSTSSDNLGQQYNTPEYVVAAGADLAVVGRGITEASNKLEATLEYKKELWAAYEKRTFRDF